MKVLLFCVIAAVCCWKSSFAALAIVSSNGEACSQVDSTGMSTFTLKTSTPELATFDFLLVQFNTTRKLPISTTAFHDGLNAVKNVPRPAEPFGPLPCPQLPVKVAQQDCTTGFSMTEAQKLTSNGRYTWDRGHLTPVNPMRFSADAANKTFFCVNIAPQDSYTNQQPWRIVEVSSETKLHAYAGAFVQTGVCPEDNLVDGPETYRGWRIPKCFWKLMCYKDQAGVTQVVGFIGENTLVPIGDTSAQDARDESTKKARSQSEILALLSRPELVGKAWTTAGTRLLTGRGVSPSKIPTAKECTNALSASSTVLQEWSEYVQAGN